MLLYTYNLPLYTYNLRLYTYNLSLYTYNLSLYTYNLSLYTYNLPKPAYNLPIICLLRAQPTSKSSNVHKKNTVGNDDTWKTTGGGYSTRGRWGGKKKNRSKPHVWVEFVQIRVLRFNFLDVNFCMASKGTRPPAREREGWQTRVM